MCAKPVTSVVAYSGAAFGYDFARDIQSVRIVGGQMIGNT
jgi:hypothetical protein